MQMFRKKLILYEKIIVLIEWKKILKKQTVTKLQDFYEDKSKLSWHSYN